MATILLLDDEDVLRILLADILEEEGHTVMQGSDGLLAYNPDVIARTDLMITDLYMPNIDGMSAILNARKDRPDLKIIAMSGGGDFVKKDFLPTTQHFGASAILRKPFKPDELLAKVRELLAAPDHPVNFRPQQALAS